MPRKNFTDSSLTFAPKRRIKIIGRRERSKNLKVFSPSPFQLYAFSPRNSRSFCKLFPRGLLCRWPLISLRGGSAKKSKLLVRQCFWCNSLLTELRSDRLRCLFILSYKKTLDFFAKCGYNINRGYTKLTVTPIKFCVASILSTWCHAKDSRTVWKLGRLSLSFIAVLRYLNDVANDKK